MSTTILLLLSPFLLLVSVFGVVVIVTLCQARTEDVPAVLKECGSIFRRLADRLPNPSNLRETGALGGHNALEDERPEEEP